MLPQQYRLRRSKDIAEVFKKGKRLKDGPLFSKILENKSGKVRFAFIVSAKTCRNAVDRNKIKRRAREALKMILPGFKKGADAVFIFQREAKDKKVAELTEILTRLCEKAGIL